MTSWIVIDGGVFLATVLEEEHSEQAKALIDWTIAEKMQIAAPTLLLYEITSSLRKIVHRQTMRSDDGARILRHLLTLRSSIELLEDNVFHSRSYQLATAHGLPSAYDAQYLAVAESLNCDFWTYDRRWFNTVSAKLSWVHFLEQFAQPPSQE